MIDFKNYMLSIMNDERKSPESFFIKLIISFVSFFYMNAIKLSYFLHEIKLLKTHRVSARVISIGNITLGGTGKTPFTIKYAKRLIEKGKKVAVLTRGSGDDESHLLKSRLEDVPVIIGRDRVKNAQKAIDQYGCDTIILDDGFQHQRLARDLEIVLIDSTNPFGNEKLFPRGILREPLDRLKKADVIILTKSDMGKKNIQDIRTKIKNVKSDIMIAESFYNPSGLNDIITNEKIPLSYAKDKKVIVVSGIGNPRYFYWIIEKTGALIKDKFFYSDHHGYTVNDAASIFRSAVNYGANCIITTEKDVFRSHNKQNLAHLFKAFDFGASCLKLLSLDIDFELSMQEEEEIVRLGSIHTC